MTEKLLQFIWSFQYFNKKELQTDKGDDLQIIFQGQHNFHQGPDFLEAKVKIGDTILVGNIELHVLSSDWVKHAHDEDKNYNNIVLHVVWENDQASSIKDLPTLSLNDRVPKLLLKKYEELMNVSTFVPCEKMISQVCEIVVSGWKQRLMIERLQRKCNIVHEYLSKTNQHWEEVFWWMLAKNFGIKINAEAFEAMAKTISINILAKHKSQIHQLEALLLGQAGLLENNFSDDYAILLQKEYRFLGKKYKLEPIALPVHFLRMRPSNFPSLRLAQLAKLIQQSTHLFSKIKEMGDAKEVKELLLVEANDYWNNHYVFDEMSAFKIKTLGKQMADNIIINTIVPILFAFGHFLKEDVYKEKAIKWMEEISPEKNNITIPWKILGMENKNAFDSQSLIELKTQYCDNRKCLECAIGNSILKNGS